MITDSIGNVLKKLSRKMTPNVHSTFFYANMFSIQTPPSQKREGKLRERKLKAGVRL